MSKKREKKFAEISHRGKKYRIELHDSWVKRLLSGWLKWKLASYLRFSIESHFVLWYTIIYNQPLLKWRRAFMFAGDKLDAVLNAYRWAGLPAPFVVQEEE